MPLVSTTVTAQDAAQHDGTPASPARTLAGELARPWEPLRVRAANGALLPVPEGAWVVLYAPGDIGVMDNGEYERWFGTEAAR